MKVYQFNQGLFLIILLKLILFFSPSIFAKCKNESYLIFPPSGCVPANARFIVEGFGNGQLKIEKVKTGDVILTSHLNTIQLIPDKINTGQFLVSQLLLKPAEPLLQGALYFLSINGIDSSYFSFHGDTKKKGWYSNGSLDIEKPVWLENPVVVDRKELGHDDNSPSWIRIITKIRDQNPVYVFVKLKTSFETNFSHSYILPVKNGMILIGHGICSGPFTINTGVNYSATLIPLDISGNYNESSVKMIQFFCPKR